MRGLFFCRCLAIAVLFSIGNQASAVLVKVCYTATGEMDDMAYYDVNSDVDVIQANTTVKIEFTYDTDQTGTVDGDGKLFDLESLMFTVTSVDGGGTTVGTFTGFGYGREDGSKDDMGGTPDHTASLANMLYVEEDGAGGMGGGDDLFTIGIDKDLLWTSTTPIYSKDSTTGTPDPADHGVKFHDIASPGTPGSAMNPFEFATFSFEAPDLNGDNLPSISDWNGAALSKVEGTIRWEQGVSIKATLTGGVTSVVATAVPEPSAFALLAFVFFGTIGNFFYKKRKAGQNASG